MLNRMRVAMRQAWAKSLLSDLLPILEEGDKVIFLAGKRYREFLVEPLIDYGCNVEVPMEGLTIGKQLKWLNDNWETNAIK